MNRAARTGTIFATVAIAAILGGCAVGQQHRESIVGLKVDRGNIGLATRAQAALAGEQFTTAVGFAERAVENTPNDAGFRGLLGNCYFASGRFASAEAAYRDSLSLVPNQPQLVLKLALVEIAQGKTGQALALLDSARNSMDPADYGLAIALAGRPDDAVAVLNQAARATGADARVRQNLALAYGLSGDWTMARTVAAQDLAPDQVDSRVQQWMAMATPGHSSDQVAELTGVHPSVDPGQPQRLALQGSPAPRQAYAEIVVPNAQPAIAEVAPTPPAALPEPPPALAQADVPEPAIAEAARTLLQPPASVDAPIEEAAAAPVAELPTRFEVPVQTASYVPITNSVRHAAEHERHSTSVVQLGAYGSPERVAAAWGTIVKRYPALRDYTPMRARFEGSSGTVWRLSIKGFASHREAASRCELLQSRGGKCFVRQVSGDSPVQFASR